MLGVVMTLGMLLPAPCPRSATLRGRPRRFPVIKSNAESIKTELVSLIPIQRFGAPATNVTLSHEMVRRLGSTVARLEALSGEVSLSNPATLHQLNGNWKLLYSDASEITRLVDLPLGFRLGAVFQLIDVSAGE